MRACKSCSSVINVALADQLSALVAKRKCQKGEVFERMSQPAHVNLLFTLRYTLPIFRFLKTLQSKATSRLVNDLRYRTCARLHQQSQGFGLTCRDHDRHREVRQTLETAGTDELLYGSQPGPAIARDSS